MLIRHCAWHPAFFHRRKLLGLTLEWWPRLRFTSGMCRPCQTKMRAGERVAPRGRDLVAEARRQIAAEQSQ